MWISIIKSFKGLTHWFNSIPSDWKVNLNDIRKVNLKVRKLKNRRNLRNITCNLRPSLRH